MKYAFKQHRRSFSLHPLTYTGIAALLSQALTGCGNLAPDIKVPDVPPFNPFPPKPGTPDTPDTPDEPNEPDNSDKPDEPDEPSTPPDHTDISSLPTQGNSLDNSNFDLAIPTNLAADSIYNSDNFNSTQMSQSTAIQIMDASQNDPLSVSAGTGAFYVRSPQQTTAGGEGPSTFYVTVATSPEDAPVVTSIDSVISLLDSVQFFTTTFKQLVNESSTGTTARWVEMQPDMEKYAVNESDGLLVLTNWATMSTDEHTIMESIQALFSSDESEDQTFFCVTEKNTEGIHSSKIFFFSNTNRDDKIDESELSYIANITFDHFSRKELESTFIDFTFEV